jgi:hypothetical protein
MVEGFANLAPEAELSCTDYNPTKSFQKAFLDSVLSHKAC